MRTLIALAFSKLGLAAITALILAATGSYFLFKHNIRAEAQKDIVIESQATEIQHLHGTADKLNKVNNAKDNLRNTTRTQPDRLRENDGYRRD